MHRTKILYLGNKLSKHGFTPTSVETLGERLKENFHVIQYSSVRNPLLRLIHFWWALLRWSGKADYVLIDTYSTAAFHYAWTCGRLASLLGIRYIPILRGGNLTARFSQNLNTAYSFLNNAHQIVSPSGYLKKVIEDKFKIPVKLIPNFIDLENYPYRKKTMETIRLLWVRSFHEIYNPELAIHVLRLLHDKGYTDSKLCMIGPDKDGSLKKTQELAEELRVIQHVRFTGRLSKAQWITLSELYNIFINTTDIDNTPVSVMEAMALGFPVISTNVGGVPYLIEDKATGILVYPNNPHAMVEAIETLLENPGKARRFSAAARKETVKFSWPVVRDQWKTIFNTLSK